MGESPLGRHPVPGAHRQRAYTGGAVRGLLHDLGHELTTLSYLVEAVRGDASLPSDSAWRLELLSLEISRLLDMVSGGLQPWDPGMTEPVSLRQVASQVASLTGSAQTTEVTLLPGPDVTAELNPVVLWRVLSNVVGNAARAAGPGGHVTLGIHCGGTTVIEVSDDGPGFGAGPPGMASLGLEVVTSLLEACGGSLQLRSQPGGGTTARVTLPAGAATVQVSGQRMGG